MPNPTNPTQTRRVAVRVGRETVIREVTIQPCLTKADVAEAVAALKANAKPTPALEPKPHPAK